MTDISTSIRVLADSAALGLARESLRNPALREAMDTVPLEGGIRIGRHDILKLGDPGARTYSIRANRTGGIVVEGLVFYETALCLLRALNRGESVKSGHASRLIRDNEAYVRLRSDAEVYSERADYYHETRNTHRAVLNENRLSDALARARLLQARLLQRLSY